MADMPPFAEYPRPDVRFGRGPGVYLEAIGEAWSLVRQDLGHWVAATVVLLVAGYAALLPFGPLLLVVAASLQRDPLGPGLASLLGGELAAGVVLFTVQGLLQAGMIGLGVRKARGEYINVGMIFEPFRRFGTMVGALLLNAVVLGAAAAACFLPLLYFLPVLLLMPTVAHLRGLGPVESLSTTFDACKRFGLGLLALHLVMGALLGASMLCLVLPVLVTYPIYCVTMAIHYRAFFESAPPSNAPIHSRSLP